MSWPPDQRACDDCVRRANHPGARCPVCRRVHGHEYAALLALGFPEAIARHMIATAGLKPPCTFAAPVSRSGGDRPPHIISGYQPRQGKPLADRCPPSSGSNVAPPHK
jgi:hypothetical protein